MDQLTLASVSSATRTTLRAKHAPKTRQQYDPIVLKFADFCRERDIEVSAPGLIAILDFLQSRLDDGLAYSTIKSSAAALRDAYAFSPVRDLFHSQLYFDFLRGCERCAPPPRTSCFVWNPDVPLRRFLDRPRPADFLESAREAMFLFLMASALRVSDIERLAFDYSELADGSLIFSYFLKRKTRVGGKFSDVQLLPPLRDEAHSRLCPVRAVKHYLDLAGSIRKPGVRALFIHSKGRAATMLTLRRWVCDVLLASGIKATPGSCRSASASLAYFKGVSLDRITSSAGWSRSSTFREFYCRPVYSVPTVLFENTDVLTTD